MPSYQKVTILGHLGKDPETKTFQNGGKICQFSVATSESWQKDGEWQERTVWHNIAVSNEKLAEKAQAKLRKGSLVYIEGQIQTREYEKDGQKRQSFEIAVRPFRGELILWTAKAILRSRPQKSPRSMTQSNSDHLSQQGTASCQI